MQDLNERTWDALSRNTALIREIVYNGLDSTQPMQAVVARLCCLFFLQQLRGRQCREREDRTEKMPIRGECEHAGQEPSHHR